MIRLAQPLLGAEEHARVAAVLASGMLVQGETVRAFEEALADRCGRRHAVACASGTSAIELALSALGIEDGEVLCPDLSWPSPAHAIVRAGALPHLVDVDAGTWNVTAETLALARTEGTRAAIVIDQFGMPAEVDAIEAALPDLPVIVDAACSLGSTLAGRPAGSFGRIACLSFHPRKLITTGEGGACLTDDDALAHRLRTLRNHGQSGPGVFEMAAGNHRMTEVAAALGLAQLERLDAIVERRRVLRARYEGALSLPGQAAPPGASSNCQTFGVLLGAGVARDEVVAALRARGIEAGRLSYALHRLGSLAAARAEGPFDVADLLDARGLALPLHPRLTDEDQDRVIRAMGAFA